MSTGALFPCVELRAKVGEAANLCRAPSHARVRTALHEPKEERHEDVVDHKVRGERMPEDVRNPRIIGGPRMRGSERMPLEGALFEVLRSKTTLSLDEPATGI